MTSESIRKLDAIDLEKLSIEDVKAMKNAGLRQALLNVLRAQVEGNEHKFSDHNSSFIGDR